MPKPSPKAAPAVAPGSTVTKAILRAAERLGISNKLIAAIVGLSEATVSRMGSGGYVLQPGEKPFELSVLLVRLYRSLDAMTGGDDAVARTWLRSENTALGGTPLTLVQSVQGLVNVIAYLDARRAVS
ncbi:MAG: antitoxin Xre/MbcA/ParS toxin-binding domain-containing protein [Alphaproteobacteria bacterium]